MYLGKLPRPAFGVRIPDIVAPAILKCFKKLNITGTLMLSFNRETAPEKYIKSLDQKHFYLGHTGTSIGELIDKITHYSSSYSTPVEIEADHVSIMGSVERALKKIAGVLVEEPLTQAEIQFSLEYIEEEFREVSKNGGVDFVTIDTCELINYNADKIPDKEVIDFYESHIEPDVRKELERYYVDKTFEFVSDDRILRIKLRKPDVARLYLKYSDSIEYTLKVYDLIRKYVHNEFGVEIAFDETPYKSNLKDILYFTLELKRRGLEPDFLAPNIGYKKREDYDNELKVLYEDLKNIVTLLNGLSVNISIHSGSGHNPYSDKGYGVWRTIGIATYGRVKYKMSGVFIQLLLEVMSRMPLGSKPRKIYEEIYDAVIDHLKRVIETKEALYSKELESMLRQYEGSKRKWDPRANIFRHYFYVFQALRNEKSCRVYRETLIQLYNEDPELRRAYEHEVYELIERLALALNYTSNSLRYRRISSL
ncbi:MAG: tagaturonate epimerase family protein [Ignisphaera sp.]|uniref:Tagaturonate/fructuronate epimerase n=1 Tax=Ignisphaera aggregans TaxID=334771 RepID=A0A7C4JJ57_9CREN